MIVSELQARMLTQLRLALADTPEKQFTYRSEWLGDLPYGAYHWIEIGGDDVTARLPPDWQRADLEAIEAAGFVRKLREWQNPKDEYELTIHYELRER